MPDVSFRIRVKFNKKQPHCSIHHLLKKWWRFNFNMCVERGVLKIIDPGTKRINTKDESTRYAHWSISSPKLNKRSTWQDFQGCLGALLSYSFSIVAFFSRNLAGGFSFQRTFGQAACAGHYQPLKPPGTQQKHVI